MPILRLDCFSALCLLLYFASNHGLNPETFDSQNVSMKYSDIKPIPSLLGMVNNREIEEENKDFGIIITKINKSGSKGIHNVEYIESSDPEEKHDFFQYSEGFEDGEDIKTFKNQEYEENPLSTNLAAFGKKINIKDSGTTLPVFLNEPQNSFIVKNRPVSLKCKAAYTLQVHFKCSGSSQPPPSVHESHVDPHSGVHMEEVTATVHRDLVDEYFGKGPFQCECHAWSSRGVTKSQAATINVAYIRKQFVLSPTSLRVELGSYAELQCKSPNGIPTPTISWHKNHLPIKDAEGTEILANGSLVLHKVSLQDMANYTCYAENIAGKRISDSAVLIVYVNGGWSSWSSWKDCKCFGKLSQGRKRTRSCNNPLPLNGGLACNGPQVQKSSDCLNCPEDVHIVNSDSIEAYGAGRWSSWGEWSSCSADCIQVRRRKCIIHSMEDTLLENADIQSLNKGFTKSMCSGKDFQTVECRGELCLIGKNDSDWALYLSLAFIAVICLAFFLAIMCCAKRGFTSSPEYNIARTVFESKYVANNEKKIINRNFVMDGNVNYDYANPDHTSISGELAISEHHYDIPNLSANYTNPIDGLSVGYINDTSDTSTSTSDSVNYNFTRKECLSVSKCSGKINSIKDVFNETGGCLRLYDGKVMVYIPEFALGNYDKKNVSLAVLGEEFSRINIKSYDSMLIISTIVSCYPLNFSFLKPCILKIPHCLTDPSLWNISVYSSEAGNNDINVKWETITKVGISTNTSKFFIKIDKLFAYIMTEKMGRFAILAQPNPNMGNLSIEMKLLAFGQVAPNCSAGSVRVYIVKDFPNSREICSKIESQLGGTFLGESRTFSFYLNECDLNIRIQPTGGWESQSHLQEQVIPYNHILSNNSILHCEFCLKKEESNIIKISLGIDFSQSNNGYHNLNTFVVPQSSNNSPTSTDNEKQIISFANRGHLINKICTESIIPRKIKDILCASLDPLRTDENDWRSFSSKLNLLEYIEYGLARPNPTENIINLWECRNSQNNLHDLKRILKEIHREDIVDLIERNSDPIWL